MTTRRGVLLATAAGWLEAQLGPSERAPSGVLVGASAGRGHVLRDGPLPSFGPLDDTADIVVVGAGASGLSAAWRLAPLGLDVRVLDLESFLGGTSTWGEDGPVPHPWGAHYLPAPNPEARATLRLLRELDIVTGWDAAGRPTFDGRWLCHSPQERLFYRGAWHAGLTPSDALDRATLDELTRFTDTVEGLTDARGSDGRFLFQIPVLESSRDPDTLALDRISMREWLEREGFSTDFVRWYVRYATLDDFGGDPDDVSAWAGLHYFAARKLRGDALEGSHYLVFPEGNGHFARALAERSRATLQRDALVLSVDATARGVEVRWVDARTSETHVLGARAAVLAVPSFIAQRLVANAASLPSRKASPWVVANLHVHRPALEPNAAWDSVLYDSAGLGYVDASHMLTPPRTSTVLTYFRAFGDADAARSRRALAAAVEWTSPITSSRISSPRTPISRVARRASISWSGATRCLDPRSASSGIVLSRSRSTSRLASRGVTSISRGWPSSKRLSERACSPPSTRRGALASTRERAGREPYCFAKKRKYTTSAAAKTVSPTSSTGMPLSLRFPPSVGCSGRTSSASNPGRATEAAGTSSFSDSSSPSSRREVTRSAGPLDAGSSSTWLTCRFSARAISRSRAATSSPVGPSSAVGSSLTCSPSSSSSTTVGTRAGFSALPMLASSSRGTARTTVSAL
ncbi:MAG: FAD-dependent oxidoreductase [Polyangiaceae bacterium]